MIYKNHLYKLNIKLCNISIYYIKHTNIFKLYINLYYFINIFSQYIRIYAVCRNPKMFN